MWISLLLDALVFVALPFAAWRLLHQVVPLAVLPILIGLLISVSSFQLGFGPAQLATVPGDLLGWGGVLLLAFSAGLEARPSGDEAAREPRIDRISQRQLLLSAVAGLVVPFVIGALVAGVGLLAIPAWHVGHVSVLVAAAGVGLCMAVSALPVLVGIVRELPEVWRPLGRLALHRAVIDDVVLWSGLGGLLVLLHAEADVAAWEGTDLVAVILLAALAGLGRWIDRRQMNFGTVTALAAAAAYLAIGAWSTNTLGLHLLLGAYIAGAVLPRSAARKVPAERIGFFALAALAPLFFGHRGIAIDGGVLDAAVLIASVVLFVLSAGSKVVAAMLVPPSDSLTQRETIALGCLLQCKGLMEIVAATILRDQGAITEHVYAMLVTVAVISTTLTGPMFRCVTGWRRYAAWTAECKS